MWKRIPRKWNLRILELTWRLRNWSWNWEKVNLGQEVIKDLVSPEEEKNYEITKIKALVTP